MQLKTFKECCAEVAKAHRLGSTLVTGHKAAYFTEAAELYAGQFKLENTHNLINNENLKEIKS